MLKKCRWFVYGVIMHRRGAKWWAVGHQSTHGALTFEYALFKVEKLFNRLYWYAFTFTMSLKNMFFLQVVAAQFEIYWMFRWFNSCLGWWFCTRICFVLWLLAWAWHTFWAAFLLLRYDNVHVDQLFDTL